MYLRPLVFLKTVTTAGTRERLHPGDLRVSALIIQAEQSNTNNVYVGDNQVSSTNYGLCMDAGDATELSAERFGMAGALISLRDIWLDVDTSTEGVSVMCLVRGE